MAGMEPIKNPVAGLMPPWTREQAVEMGRKGGKAKRNYSLRGALARHLKTKRPDGSRPWDDAVAAFVTKLMEGDVRAIELAMNSVDGPQASEKKHTHRLARELIVAIRPDGDRRGLSPALTTGAEPTVIDVSASGPSPATRADAHTSDNGCDVAQSGQVEAQSVEQREVPAWRAPRTTPPGPDSGTEPPTEAHRASPPL